MTPSLGLRSWLVGLVDLEEEEEEAVSVLPPGGEERERERRGLLLPIDDIHWYRSQ